MKRALALVALTAAALLATAPLASADTAADPAAGTSTTQPAPFEVPPTPFNGDTSWGGACETPECNPVY
ncbi:hypothetical protein [Kitasatospora cheerisanensis]|nr:hypothetical protein [Kitasatospora cheerisanensis]